MMLNRYQLAACLAVGIFNVAMDSEWWVSGLMGACVGYLAGKHL